MSDLTPEQQAFVSSYVMQHGAADIDAAITAAQKIYPAPPPPQETTPAAPVNPQGGYLSDSRLPYGQVAIDPETLVAWIAAGAGLTPSGIDKLKEGLRTGVQPQFDDADRMASPPLMGHAGLTLSALTPNEEITQ